jgi:deazaflavin-dependent oxidoreductase (nitroreductase family)
MRKLTMAFEPIGRRLAGSRWFPLWAILRHTGRRSGTHYAIPVVALPTDDGFLIPVPFGSKTQWVQNLLTSRRGGVRWRGHEYGVTRPELVELDDPEVATQLSAPIRFMSHRIGIDDWVRVSRAEA